MGTTVDLGVVLGSSSTARDRPGHASESSKTYTNNAAVINANSTPEPKPLAE